MLTSESINAGIKTAEILESNGLKIKPESNSPIQTLISCSFSGLDNLSKDNIYSNLNVIMNTNELAKRLEESCNQYLHNNTLADCAQFLSNSVMNHINIFKNTIKPIILESLEKLSDVFNQESEKPFLYDIKIKDFPSLLKDNEFVQLIKSYCGRNNNDFNTLNKLSNLNKTNDELIEFVLTGDDNLDKKIKEWIITLQKDFLLNVWDIEFCKKINTDIEDNLKISYLMDYALAVWLIANKLENSSVENDLNIRLFDFKKDLLTKKEGSSEIIISHVEKWEQDLDNKILIVNTVSWKNEITVNKEIYEEFILNGGKPEVILGLLRIDKSFYDLNSIQENSEKLYKAWNSYLSLARIKNDNAKTNLFKRCIESVFNNGLLELTQVEKHFCPGGNYGSHLDRCYQLLESELDCLTIEDVENTSKTVTRIITRCRFYFTDSEKFFMAFENYVQRVKPSDIKEAATAAIAIYLADYIIDQLKISNGYRTLN